MNWFKRFFTRKIEITIKLDESYSSLTGFTDGNFLIKINPKECPDTRTVLAHELGHFIDNLVTPMSKNLNDAYAVAITSGIVNRDILKHEASAWRHACEIYPKLDRKHIKYAYGTYLYSYKKTIGLIPFFSYTIGTSNQILTVVNHPIPRREDEGLVKSSSDCQS